MVSVSTLFAFAIFFKLLKFKNNNNKNIFIYKLFMH